MSGYQISVCKAANFGPFAEIEYDLSMPGLTLIEGIIEDMPGSDSNGSGKSMLFEIPTWATYGRCLRPKFDGDGVIRLIGPDHNRIPIKEGAWAEVNLTGGVDTVSWRRYRKHPQHRDKLYLYVNGQDVTRGTNAQTQLAIEQIIGLDFTAFTNAVAFGAREDVKTFFSAPDAERKKVLEKILGLELYSEAEKVARRRIAAVATDLQDKEMQSVELQGKLAEQRASLNTLLTGETADDLRFTLTRQRVRVKALKKSCDKATAALASANDELGAEQEKFEVIQAAWQEKYDAWAKERSALDATAYRLEFAALPQAESAVSQAEAQLTRMRKLAGQHCPTCQQEVDPSHLEGVSKALRTALADAKAKVTHLGVEIDEKKELRERMAEPIAPVSPMVDALHEVYRQADEALSGLTADLRVESASLAQMEDRFDALTVQVKGVQEKVDESDRELVAIAAQIETLKVSTEQLQFWVEGFGNAGLKSFLIEAEIPEINRRATVYAQRLLVSGTVVRLRATKQLKTRDAIREELVVEASIPRFASSYEAASKGQKRRLDLSLLLAFRDLVGERSTKSFRQFFADELFDGVDKSGCETVGEVLRELSKDCPVLLVTHDQRLKPIADRVITVRHDGDRAVVAHGAKSDTNPRMTQKKVVRGR